jgi:hypothetical protein
MCAVFKDVLARSREISTSTDASEAEEANETLRALFAKAATTTTTTTTSTTTASASTPTRVLQAPRKVTGTSAAAVTPPKSKQTTIGSGSVVVDPSAVRGALLELIEDDAFIARLADAISRRAAS